MVRRSPNVLLVVLALFVLLLAKENAAQTRPQLGVIVADARGAGAEVATVQPDSPAAKAGIRPGDVIVAVDGRASVTAAAMVRLVAGLPSHQPVRLTAVRGQGASEERMTITCYLAGALAARDVGRMLPPTGASTPPPVSRSADGTGASGYVLIADPIEHAFTVLVPAGWSARAGLARRAALQINPYVRALSPDKMTYLLIGEPTLPSFVPPSQMGNAIGYGEGKLYDAGLGGLTLVLRYLPGDAFARYYGSTTVAGLCPDLRFTSEQNRPDLARKAAALWPTLIPSREDGGEARFSCTHHGKLMDIRVDAVTRISQGGFGWNVIMLDAFIAPVSQSAEASSILNHMLDSIHFSDAWVRMQNDLSAEAAREINQRMQQIFRQQQTYMQQINAEDSSFESMDELVSGFSTYHDAATGKSYSLSNANSYYIEESTGRILSSPIGTRPAWASAYVPLTRGSR